MTNVASKNLFDLLGNDDGDSDTPKGPVKTVDKTSTRTAKRNTDGLAPASQTPATGNRRGGFSGSEGAFRDRGAGADRNRSTRQEGESGEHRRGGHSARVRGGRGARYPRDRDDRHTKGNPGGGSEKQAAAGWGANEGEAELKDEQAGEAIAKSDEKEAAAEGDVADAEKVEEEPEDNHISYADYLAQQAEKKLALDSEFSIRKPNEGTKNKFENTKQLVKDDDEEFISGTGGKAKRERERKQKVLVEIDNRYVEPERTGGRGGARGGRGDRRGDFAGRGRGGDSGRGRGGDSARGAGRGGRGGRGDHRGDHRGGARGGPRGGAGGLNTSDESAFPSLGGK